MTERAACPPNTQHVDGPAPWGRACLFRIRDLPAQAVPDLSRDAPKSGTRHAARPGSPTTSQRSGRPFLGLGLRSGHRDRQFTAASLGQLQASLRTNPLGTFTRLMESVAYADTPLGQYLQREPRTPSPLVKPGTRAPRASGGWDFGIPG